MFDRYPPRVLDAASVRAETLVIVHPEDIAAAPGARLRACRELIESWKGSLYALDDVRDCGAHGPDAAAFLEAVDAAVYDHPDRRSRGRVHADSARGLTADAVRLVLRLSPSDAVFRIMTVDEGGWGETVARLLTAAGHGVVMSSVAAPQGQGSSARAAA